MTPNEFIGGFMVVIGIIGSFIAGCIEPNLINTIISVGFMISGSILVSSGAGSK